MCFHLVFISSRYYLVSCIGIFCGGSIYDQCRCFWHFLLLPQEVATGCELHWWTTLFCIWRIFFVVLVWYFCVQVFLVFPTVAARGRQPLQLHWWTQFWLNSFCQHYYLTTVKEELLRDLKNRHWCVLWVLFWKWWQSSPAELFSEITQFSFGFHLGVYSGLVWPIQLRIIWKLSHGKYRKQANQTLFCPGEQLTTVWTVSQQERQQSAWWSARLLARGSVSKIRAITTFCLDCQCQSSVRQLEILQTRKVDWDINHLHLVEMTYKWSCSALSCEGGFQRWVSCRVWSGWDFWGGTGGQEAPTPGGGKPTHHR